MSKPVMGMLIGLCVGVLVGVLGIDYFEVTGALGRVCLVASSLLVFQLLGATIAATIGKPHQVE